MIIVAGALYVHADERDEYLRATSAVNEMARAARGCLDFVQAADPLDPERINVFERWDSDEALMRFRGNAAPELDAPSLTSADVHKYRISAVEPP